MDFQVFLFDLIIIYLSARLLSELASRLGQPAVLGEILAGIILGGSVLGLIEQTETLKLLGEIGIMLLLFEIGLESDLQQFLKAGPAALTVATIGIVMPFLLGAGLALLLDLTQLQAFFVGASLSATSIAITARVLSDLGKLNTPEGNIILGAAVIDDIVGLVMLSVCVGLARSGTVSWIEIGRMTSLAIGFLVGAIVLGIRYAHQLSALVERMRTRGGLITAAVLLTLIFGYLADLMLIAPLVGAFAAGLVLARTEHQVRIQESVRPVTDIFVPIFFVLVGTAFDVRYFNFFNPDNWQPLLFAGGLTVAAIAGKLMSGIGLISSRANRWVIGVGMVPRGEVGLIFAGAGLANHIINPAEYGALLIMVVLTTLAAPFLLKMLFKT
jgi:Kef-type K+ transport system membrane component KefB